jgi:hypothetical protein
MRPTPFALADPARVRRLLNAAGFDDIALDSVDEPLRFGLDADDVYGFLQTMGIVEWLIHDLDPASRSRALDELRSTFQAHEHDGGVTFGSSAWLITARAAPE